MDIIQWILIIVIVLFLVNRFMPKKGITNITVQEAKEKISDNSVQFIDVRTPGEYQANHSKPFKNIPLSNLPSQINKLEKDKEVVVICQSGMRSAQAANMLKKEGFEHIYNVRGGMGAWH